MGPVIGFLFKEAEVVGHCVRYLSGSPKMHLVRALILALTISLALSKSTSQNATKEVQLEEPEHKEKGTLLIDDIKDIISEYIETVKPAVNEIVNIQKSLDDFFKKKITEASGWKKKFTTLKKKVVGWFSHFGYQNFLIIKSGKLNVNVFLLICKLYVNLIYI